MDKLIGSREWHEHCKRMADVGFPVGDSFAATHLNAPYPATDEPMPRPVKSIDTLTSHVIAQRADVLPTVCDAWTRPGKVVIG